MMNSEVLLADLASIVDAGGPRSRQAHGVSAVDQIVPAGHYRRRVPAYLDTQSLRPSEAIFKVYTDTRFQGFGPLRRFVLRDAVVTDQGAAVTRGGALIEESCWEFLVHGHVPFGLTREGERHFHRTAEPSITVEAPTLLLKRPWWRNYGHWMIDAAALVALLARRGIGGFEQIVIGAAESSGLREVFRDTLALVAPGVRVLEHEDRAMWRFSELHYVQPVRRPPLFTLPAAVEALAQAVLGGSDAPPSAGRRLFVSRQHYDRRRLDNESEVVAVCERYGFETVFPETLPLREQVELFRSASAIAGVKGAGLTNLVFAPRSAAVIALSPGDFADPFFWDIAAGRGMAYAEMFGPLTTADRPTALNPFTIDPGRLDAMLHAVLGAPAPVAVSAPTPAPISAPAVRPPAPAAVGGFPEPLAGDFYLGCLQRIHRRTQPRRYLEIGTLNGLTLALSRCHSVAIDPAFRMTARMPGAMPSLFLFQGASDLFFAEIDPRAVLGGPIDLAFLDGMHLFEYLLRDFMNTERHCHSGSTILLHDCVPLDADMTGRERIVVQSRPNQRYPGWWTGDVWKAVDVLLRWRPDLDVVAFDAPPTGLVMVRNLDPGSHVLEREYAAIVEEYRSRSAPGDFAAYFARLPMRSTAAIEALGPIPSPAQAASIASA